MLSGPEVSITVSPVLTCPPPYSTAPRWDKDTGPSVNTAHTNKYMFGGIHVTSLHYESIFRTIEIAKKISNDPVPVSLTKQGTNFFTDDIY